MKNILNENKKIEKEFKEMLYVLSHDLRSPLIIIQEFTRDLLKNGENFNNEEMFSIKRIYENAINLESYLNGILEISRLFTTPSEIFYFETKTIINEIVLDLKQSFSKSFDVVQRNMPKIRAEKEILRKIFKHIIKNAIIFGGTKIEISYDDNSKLFCIKDNGIGIYETEFENIFKMGIQLKELKTSGVGIGLTYCKKAVEKNGGRIFVKSKKNIGSQFFFSLEN